MFPLRLILALSLLTCANADSLSIRFLSEFFHGQATTITANVCWNYDDMITLTKTFSNAGLKLMGIYRNTTDVEGFFQFWGTKNFYFIDMRGCSSSWAILKNANYSNYFQYPFKWLLLVDREDQAALIVQLETYNILPNSHLVIGSRNGTTVDISEVYKTSINGNLIWEKYGQWTESDGIIREQGWLAKGTRRKNLHRAEIIVAVIINDDQTWNHLEDFKRILIDNFAQQSFLNVKIMLEYCNADYRLKKTADFGYLNKTNQQWSGLVYDLMNKNADISGSSPLINPDRIHAIEYLLPVFADEKICFLLRKPPLSYVSNIFVLPFYWTVWIALVLILGLFGIAAYAILNWETKFKQKINFQDRFGINDIGLITFEILCQQGTMTEPRTVSGRTIALIFLTSFMFLYVAYSANIVALLQSTTEISTLEQLLNSPMTVGAHEIYYMRTYLGAAKDQVRTDLYQKKIGTKNFFTMDEGIERLRQGFFAFHMELDQAYYHVLKKFTNYEVCSLQELEGYAQSYGGFVAVTRNSPYKEVFKVALLKVEEHGIRRRNYKRWLNTPKCYSSGASFESVGITDVYPAIMICTYGFALAVLIFVCEQLMHRVKMEKLRLCKNVLREKIASNRIQTEN